MSLSILCLSPSLSFSLSPSLSHHFIFSSFLLADPQDSRRFAQTWKKTRRDRVSTHTQTIVCNVCNDVHSMLIMWVESEWISLLIQVFALGIFNSWYTRLHSSWGLHADRLHPPLWLLVTWGHHVRDVDGLVIWLSCDLHVININRLSAFLLWKTTRLGV